MGARGHRPHRRRCAEVARPDRRGRDRGRRRPPELFGTIDEVARGKGELVEALPPQRHGRAQRRRRLGARPWPHAPAAVGRVLRRRRRGAGPRRCASTTSCGPVPAGLAVGSVEVRLAVRGAHRSATRWPPPPPRCALGVDPGRRRRGPGRRAAVALADGAAPQRLRRGRPQRRLQRQPRLDGGRAAGAGRDGRAGSAGAAVLGPMAELGRRARRGAPEVAAAAGGARDPAAGGGRPPLRRSTRDDLDDALAAARVAWAPAGRGAGQGEPGRRPGAAGGRVGDRACLNRGGPIRRRLDAGRLAGLLAEPDRLRVVSPLALGAVERGRRGPVHRPRRPDGRLGAGTAGRRRPRRARPGRHHFLLEPAFAAAARAARSPQLTGEEPGERLRPGGAGAPDVHPGRAPGPDPGAAEQASHRARPPGPGIRARPALQRVEGQPDPGALAPRYRRLRRYLVDEGFLDRAQGDYWRTGGTVDVS